MYDSRRILREILTGFAMFTLLATSPCDLLCSSESSQDPAATTSHCGGDASPARAPNAPPCGDECPGCDLDIVSASPEDVAKRAPAHAWTGIDIARQRSAQLPAGVSTRMVTPRATPPFPRDIMAITSTMLI